ncbi:MAG: 2-amino-4-hydroxy-6-hydroxymethyldihydropteridine diphosphokinase [Candidatus Cryptobacteroides sp.]
MEKNIDVYLSLGSNIGDRRDNIDTALKLISHIPGVKVLNVSDIIETEPWGFECRRKFLNCVAEITFSPSSDFVMEEAIYLLNAMKNIEWAMGRREKLVFDINGNRIYHSRIIDIDLLIFGKYRIDTKQLVIPHPLMSERDFVMIPLMQIVKKNIKSEFPEIFAKYCESK